MKFFSIICEFNPFHTGHRHLIQQTKAKTGADAIVCIMSGSMVQRGDVAIYDKWARAKAAIKNGADLVVELPVCYVLQSADIFARGGVEIAEKMGTYGIAFGSECTDESLLWEMAEIKACEPSLYSEKLKQAMDSGVGYPAACKIAMESVLGKPCEDITNPNTTLGVSYMANILKINPRIKIHTEKRIGDYHSADLSGEFASATAIREKILSGDKICDFSLCTSDDIYDINILSPYILGFFRTADEKNLERISGMEDGLANRLIQKSKETTSYEDFVNECVTKRYTRHRIRRLILCSLLGIDKIYETNYVRVLALNDKGAKILKQIKKEGNIEVITKLGNTVPNLSLKKDILATDIASLCAGKKASMDYIKSPYIYPKE